MKKLFLMTALLVSSLFAMAQQNHMVWREGRVLYAMPVNSMDSITFMDDADQMDTLYMLLPRTMVRVDIVYVHDTIYKCPDDPDDPDAPLVVEFSVANDRRVLFASGNLQYTQSTNSWAFAAQQYEVLGTANFAADGQLADKIDLFGWSGSTGLAQWGIGVRTDSIGYSGSFVDWGKNIEDSTTWRTLTIDEWLYVANYRTNAANLIGIARIKLNEEGTEYVNGTILLPDSWTCPQGVTFTPGYGSAFSIEAYAEHQVFTLQEWALMEKAGAVFFPAAGYRYQATDNYDWMKAGQYWTASEMTNQKISAQYMDFEPTRSHWDYDHRIRGRSVRLVKDLW